jgi:uncharacterized protein (TIGR03435 family)
MGRRWFATFCLIASAAAQQSPEPPGPKFDVVSIHAVPPNSPPVMREPGFATVLPGGQFVDSRAMLAGMIMTAYDVKNFTQLDGLPNWAQTQAYSIMAKAAPGGPTLSQAENHAQVRLMLRAMLEDRFHLRLHVETRQAHVAELRVAKGGLKIQAVDPPVPPEKAGNVEAAMGDQGGRMIGKKSTMANLAGMLPVFLKRPVIDKTELQGYYDFDIKWRAVDAGDAQPGLGAAGLAMLISNLESQLGLRLTDTTGPVEYWVVDHVERPSEN